MHFSTAVSVLALAGSSLAANHTIRVGGQSASDLVFIPNNVTAAEGDIVIFKFWPKNHSIAQAAFAKPCEPLANGFWSGYVPTTDTTKAADMSYSFEVKNASQPIWFYCTQAQHCQDGMVGGINVATNGTGNTITKFIDAAKDASANVEPTATVGSGLSMTMANGTEMPSGSATGNAASPLEMSNLAMSGAFGMLAYLFM
ncbi:hypothetical protein EJ04DRAFT_448804 [Polyplosphaeria fusca]|uniref:Cupredoxin n=1 Tax=Polyplosphaeria fusca TaxID=682080 RepID=A0A9P4QJZ2_9PLEO|nr:hypothetical protein EJ04DRAFT_448804 [Polyplosphaeria fusca]